MKNQKNQLSKNENIELKSVLQGKNAYELSKTSYNNLPDRVSFAFTDVDLAISAKYCFISIWPILTNKGIYVTHDAAYIKVLQELYNPNLWEKSLKQYPPILFGAGYGLCNDSPHIGYMVKGEALTTDYLKSLTIDK